MSFIVVLVLMSVLLLCGFDLDFLQPSTELQAQEEDDAAEGEFDGHAEPHTVEAVARCQEGGEGDADVVLLSARRFLNADDEPVALFLAFQTPDDRVFVVC